MDKLSLPESESAREELETWFEAHMARFSDGQDARSLEVRGAYYYLRDVIMHNTAVSDRYPDFLSYKPAHKLVKVNGLKDGP